MRGTANARGEAIVDTEFTGALALPSAVVAVMGLRSETDNRVVLGNGAVRRVGRYAVEVEWDGSWRSVLAHATGDGVLVGLRLLAGHELRVQAVPGGTVEVTPLP